MSRGLAKIPLGGGFFSTAIGFVMLFSTIIPFDDDLLISRVQKQKVLQE
jgi:hypothetical protein